MTPTKKAQLKLSDRDGITLQFGRVSSQFFGAMADRFHKQKKSFKSRRDFDDLFLSWAAVGRHPEPEYLLHTSYFASKRKNDRAFHRFQETLERRAPHLKNIWSHPAKWSELSTLISRSGLRPFPTFVAFGPALREFLLQRKILAVSPTWEQEGDHLLPVLLKFLSSEEK